MSRKIKEKELKQVVNALQLALNILNDNDIRPEKKKRKRERVADNVVQNLFKNSSRFSYKV